MDPDPTPDRFFSSYVFLKLTVPARTLSSVLKI
jgi:hypothetical protein